jgi:membrane-bound lytic murein transglycosylase D
MEWTERQYYRLREKFKIITTETVVQTVKKEPKAALASVDVKVVKAVKITKEVRTDTLAANTATVYIVQKDNYYRSEKQCYCC